MRVILLREARGELADAVGHYNGQRKGLGDEFLGEFGKALEKIREWPTAWRKASRYSRQRRLDRFPYGVIYQVEGETIFVLAVMHLRRRPGYWKDRE